MKQLKTTFSIILLLFLLQPTNAQSDTVSARFRFKLSINYNTRLNYYGRVDSLKSSGFFPLAELWLTPKFYVNAAPVFVVNKLQHFDYAGTVATVGYQNVGTKWISNVYATKPFYKESSELVQSALKAQSGVNLTYRNSIVNINAGGDVKFSDKVDYGASAGLDHIVRIKNKDRTVLIFDPAVYAYAGTQNFQHTYYKKSRSGLLFFPPEQERVTEQANRFGVLAYEASLPVIYARGKIMFISTPSYIIPQNLVADSNNANTSEQGGNMFYATLTAKYSF